MNRERFIKERRQDWQRFESLALKFQKTRQQKWNSAEVAELSRLYRSICYDLSLVQSREWGARLEQYLNDLVAQGHNCLYRSAPKSLSGIWTFFSVGFPSLLRRRYVAFWLAFALFTVPLIVSTVLAIARPEIAETVVGNEEIQQAVEMYSSDLYHDTDLSYFKQRSGMFGFYLSNNTGIAFRAYAAGALAGVGTCLVLLSNGISIGMTQGAILGAGEPATTNFTSFVITHGAFELTAIIIAGAAGLVLAQGIVMPGNRTRIDSLRHHGKESLQLALGAGLMLFIAAIIEGYFSPLAIPAFSKYLVGTICWVAVIAYFLLAGRERNIS